MFEYVTDSRIQRLIIGFYTLITFMLWSATDAITTDEAVVLLLTLLVLLEYIATPNGFTAERSRTWGESDA